MSTNNHSTMSGGCAMSLPPLPEPEHNDHVDARFKRHNCYTADQMKSYGQQCRVEALEEAAKVCESEYDNWDNERPLRICATAIRSLKYPII